MNISTTLLALVLVSATACFSPVASADPNDQAAAQATQPAQDNDAHQDHQTLRQDVHEVGQEVRHGAHVVGREVRHDARAVGHAMHRTAHWRRYHVCTRHWHGHCTRWARRHRHN